MCPKVLEFYDFACALSLKHRYLRNLEIHALKSAKQESANESMSMTCDWRRFEPTPQFVDLSSSASFDLRWPRNWKLQNKIFFCQSIKQTFVSFLSLLEQKRTERANWNRIELFSSSGLSDKNTRKLKIKTCPNKNHPVLNFRLNLIFLVW